MAKSYSSQYYAEKKKGRYDRKELLLPKETGVLESVDEARNRLGLSFNAYTLRALTEQIARDKAFFASLVDIWVLVEDQFEIKAGTPFAAGYVFNHRPDSNYQASIKDFDSEKEAMEYIEKEDIHTEIQAVTPRISLVKEIALVKRTLDGRSRTMVSESEPIWISKLADDGSFRSNT